MSILKHAEIYWLDRLWSCQCGRSLGTAYINIFWKQHEQLILHKSRQENCAFWSPRHIVVFFWVIWEKIWKHLRKKKRKRMKMEGKKRKKKGQKMNIIYCQSLSFSVSFIYPLQLSKLSHCPGLIYQSISLKSLPALLPVEEDTERDVHDFSGLPTRETHNPYN